MYAMTLMLCIASMGFMTPIVNNTEDKASVVTTGYLVDAASAVVSEKGDRVSVFLEDFKEFKPAVVVTPPVENPLVLARNHKNPTLAVRLDKLDAKRWVLYGEEGSIWTIEIIATNEDKSWYFESFQVTVGEKPTTPDVPDEPSPDPPTEDVTEFYNSMLSSLESLRSDTQTARILHDALQIAITDIPDDSTLEAARAKVRAARIKVFESLDNLNADWSVVFGNRGSIQKWFDANPPPDAESYKALMKNGFLKALKEISA